ncbi:MAG: DNA polymerase III subunit gamma/tau [Chitinophagaceae bacterium]|nr:DNA polymerase III subunit gamma/tau [Bacteroidota bacterium]MCC6257069.1 DNA polymerase III subunit gamma/tau [Chitinophagaceae bacterium]MCW5916612.1 DNA polymerase III subunit gamma/tau [Ferruginibacter sp.]
MENFVVSARKYRPQNFNTVIGQAHITTTLKNAIRNNQLAHAFLFCGPRGVGKTTCARILAKTINCENITADGEACNTCPSCISFDSGASFNVHELDAASNNSVDDIRNLVDQVRFAPQAGKYKVYIVDEVHMLSASAFNAFLKTLEEPPPYAIFILATTEKHKILPTILSRCQIFDFKRITTKDTVAHLQEICDKEKIDAEKAALHVIAVKSEGCMRDALSILDKIVSFSGGRISYANTLEHLNILDEDYYFRLLELLQKESLPDVLLLYDEINQKGFEPEIVLEGFTEFIRNLFISKDAKAAALLDVAEDFKSKYQQLARILSTGWLIAALNLLTEGIGQIRQSRNKRLHVEMLLIKLNYLNQAVVISGAEKKKLTERNGALQFRALTILSAPRSTNPTTPAKQKPELIENTRLIIDESVNTTPEEKQVQKTRPAAASATSGNKVSLGSLKTLRTNVEQNRMESMPPQGLSADQLEKAWEAFVDKLKKQKKHSAVTVFGDVTLKVINENLFEIICKGNFATRFIELERAALIEHFQHRFNNRALSFQVSATEENDARDPKEEVLSIKQQYQLLSEQYPQIKELKDRLKLDLRL